MAFAEVKWHMQFILYDSGFTLEWARGEIHGPENKHKEVKLSELMTICAAPVECTRRIVNKIRCGGSGCGCRMAPANTRFIPNPFLLLRLVGKSCIFRIVLQAFWNHWFVCFGLNATRSHLHSSRKYSFPPNLSSSSHSRSLKIDKNLYLSMDFSSGTMMRWWCGGEREKERVSTDEFSEFYLTNNSQLLCVRWCVWKKGFPLAIQYIARSIQWVEMKVPAQWVMCKNVPRPISLYHTGSGSFRNSLGARSV